MIRLLGVAFGALLAVSQRRIDGAVAEAEQRKGGIRGATEASYSGPRESSAGSMHPKRPGRAEQPSAPWVT